MFKWRTEIKDGAHCPHMAPPVSRHPIAPASEPSSTLLPDGPQSDVGTLSFLRTELWITKAVRIRLWVVPE